MARNLLTPLDNAVLAVHFARPRAIVSKPDRHIMDGKFAPFVTLNGKRTTSRKPLGIRGGKRLPITSTTPSSTVNEMRRA